MGQVRWVWHGPGEVGVAWTRSGGCGMGRGLGRKVCAIRYMYILYIDIK